MRLIEAFHSRLHRKDYAQKSNWNFSYVKKTPNQQQFFVKMRKNVNFHELQNSEMKYEIYSSHSLKGVRKELNTGRAYALLIWNAW